MNNIKIAQSGKDLKKILNADEKTYSLSARQELIPVTVTIPKKSVIEKCDTAGGHSIFVDHEDKLWCRYQSTVSKDDGTRKNYTTFKDFKQVDPLCVNVEWFCRTTDNKYVASIRVAENSDNFGRIYYSEDNGTTWVKTLDAREEGVPNSVYRPSNCILHNDGVSEFVIVGSYGAGNNSVFISKDKGKTFSKILSLPVVDPNIQNHVHAMAVNPANGWLWVPHGDGDNRGIMYSHNALYAETPTWTEVSKGRFFQGGWQPSSVVPLLLSCGLGTDSYGGLPNGILAYDEPETSELGKIGFKAEVLGDDALTHIARKGVAIDNCIGYIPMHQQDAKCSYIFVSGDAGFSWHLARTHSFGAFELGFTNPDKDGWVYGAGSRFKVAEWDKVTKFIDNRYHAKKDYV